MAARERQAQLETQTSSVFPRAGSGAAAHVLPADPVRTLVTVLTLPNRHARLQPIDELATGAERIPAVGSAGRADHGDVPDLQRAGAVQAREPRAGQLGLDLEG